MQNIPVESKAERYVSRETLAKMLDVSPRTIDKWRFFGKGPKPTKLPTGTIRYHIDDVRSWISGQQAEAAR